MGKTRAKQDDYPADDPNRRRHVINFQGHGDAAFPTQGVSYEALTLQKLPNYDVGGTVHFIKNNQLGFTTMQHLEGRSFRYSSDVVKPFGVPVIHVNAYSPEDVVKMSKLAIQY